MDATEKAVISGMIGRVFWSGPMVAGKVRGSVLAMGASDQSNYSIRQDDNLTEFGSRQN